MITAGRTRSDLCRNEGLMKLSEKEVTAVVKLTGAQRYEYFVKKVADRNELWGLWNNGWALGATDDGESTLPLWPAEEYADLCRKDVWADYEPRSISLPDFLERLLPQMASDGIRPSIFDTPTENSVLIEMGELEHDLRTELAKIE